MGSGSDYKKQIRSSARTEFEQLCITYGAEFRVKAKGWCDALVSHMGEEFTPPFDCQINGMLETILTEKFNLEPAWTVSIRKFKDSGIWDKIKKFAYFVRTLQPPCEIRVAVSRFHCLGNSVELEFNAIYEVNHSNKSVIFDKFEVYSTT